MLKIALVRWKGKCSRHPRFNPDTDGAGAIHGNCPRCVQLQAIYDTHRRTLQLIRAWGPCTPSRSKERKSTSDTVDRQQWLFSEPGAEQREEPA